MVLTLVPLKKLRRATTEGQAQEDGQRQAREEKAKAEGRKSLRTWAADDTGKGHHSCEEKEDQTTGEIREGNCPKVRRESSRRRKKNCKQEGDSFKKRLFPSTSRKMTSFH